MSEPTDAEKSADEKDQLEKPDIVDDGSLLACLEGNNNKISF